MRKSAPATLAGGTKMLATCARPSSTACTAAWYEPAAVQAVLDGRAQVASIFVPPASVAGADFRTWLADLVPGRERELELVAYTDEAPNDGVVVQAALPAPTVEALEKTMLGLAGTPTGERLLKELFRADGFEPAPRNSYRALYRLALTSL